MRISDWSSDVCSSDLRRPPRRRTQHEFVRVRRLGGRREDRVARAARAEGQPAVAQEDLLVVHRARAGAGEVGHVVADRIVVATIEAPDLAAAVTHQVVDHAQPRRELPVEGEDLLRSEEHTSELQSLMRISYAVLCLKTNNNITHKD